MMSSVRQTTSASTGSEVRSTKFYFWICILELREGFFAFQPTGSPEWTASAMAFPRATPVVDVKRGGGS